jgi:hypothetical protein
MPPLEKQPFCRSALMSAKDRKPAKTPVAFPRNVTKAPCEDFDPAACVPCLISTNVEPDNL